MSMNRVNQILAGVLFVQIGLTAATWWPSGETVTQSRSWLGFDKDQISAITVTGMKADGETKDPLTLTLADGGWVVSSAGDYPADPDKVDKVLDALVDLKVRAPIASAASSHPSLKVADDEYGKMVAVTAGGTTKTFRLGAARNNAVNVRLDGENDVYLARGMSEWTVRDRGYDYVDPSYLDVSETIDSLTITNAAGHLSFAKIGPEWTMEFLAEGELADSAKIKGLVDKLAKIRLSDPIGKVEDAHHGFSGGTKVSYTTTAGEQTEGGTFYIGADNDSKVYVKAEGNPNVVLVPKSRVDQARTAVRTEFLKEPEAPGEE